MEYCVEVSLGDDGRRTAVFAEGNRLTDRALLLIRFTIGRYN